MKVRKWIEQYVEVEVSAEDIASALEDQSAETRNAAYSGINSSYVFLRSIPDSAIAEMDDKLRAEIARRLRQQADRYFAEAAERQGE